MRARKELGPQLVFVQYIFALSVVEAVRGLPGYEDLELRLKWPNDLYVDMGREEGLRKIGGILVNSTYAGKDFTIIIGKPETKLHFHCQSNTVKNRLRDKHHQCIGNGRSLRSHSPSQLH